LRHNFFFFLNVIDLQMLPDWPVYMWGNNSVIYGKKVVSNTIGIEKNTPFLSRSDSIYG
jgi:hypothetical protein